MQLKHKVQSLSKSALSGDRVEDRQAPEPHGLGATRSIQDAGCGARLTRDHNHNRMRTRDFEAVAGHVALRGPMAAVPTLGKSEGRKGQFNGHWRVQSLATAGVIIYSRFIIISASFKVLVSPRAF